MEWQVGGVGSSNGVAHALQVYNHSWASQILLSDKAWPLSCAHDGDHSMVADILQ